MSINLDPQQLELLALRCDQLAADIRALGVAAVTPRLASVRVYAPSHLDETMIHCSVAYRDAEAVKQLLLVVRDDEGVILSRVFDGHPESITVDQGLRPLRPLRVGCEYTLDLVASADGTTFAQLGTPGTLRVHVMPFVEAPLRVTSHARPD
jgi:hypothetical protein